jgi:hypothetical protein
MTPYIGPWWQPPEPVLLRNFFFALTATWRVGQRIVVTEPGLYLPAVA